MSQNKLTELEKLQNEKNSLLKKIDYLENVIKSKGINPSELEEKAASIDAEYKNTLRENSQMAKIISGLYKARKTPQNNMEYEHVIKQLKKRLWTLEEKDLSEKTKLEELENKLVEMETQLNGEKRDHTESKEKLLEENKKLKNEHAEQLKKLEDESKTKVEEFEKQIEELNEQIKAKDITHEDLEATIVKNKEDISKLSEEKEKVQNEANEKDSQIKELKDLAHSYKKRLEDPEFLAQQGLASDKAPGEEQIASELDEANKLLASFLKERKMPSNNNELKAWMEQKKKEVNELKKKLQQQIAEVPGLDEVKQEKLEQKKKLDEEKSKNEAYKKEIDELKALIQKLKSEPSPKQNNSAVPNSMNEESCNPGDFEQAMNLVASLMKERRTVGSDKEAQILVEKYKREAEKYKQKVLESKNKEDEEKIIALESEVKALKENVEKLKAYEQEAHSLKEIIKKHQEEGYTPAGKQKSNEAPDIEAELEQMNNLVASFLKERKLPTTNDEAEHLISKYKKDIKELEAKIKAEKDGFERSDEIQKRNKRLEELEKENKAQKEEISSLNKLAEKLKKTAHESKEKQESSIDPDIMMEEFDEMSSLVASLIKERKLPSNDEESHSLIETYKAKIASLEKDLDANKNKNYKERLEEQIEASKKLEEVIKKKDAEITDLQAIIKKNSEEASNNPENSNDAKNPDSEKSNESLEEEYNEMNKMLAELLKGRRAPHSDEEALAYIEKQKRDQDVLRKKLRKAKEESEITPEIEEKLENYEQMKFEIEDLKKKMQENKEAFYRKLEEAKDKGGNISLNPDGPTDIERDFEEMGKLVGHFLKQRKEPSGTDESQELLKNKEEEIKKLKAKIINHETEEKIESLEKKIKELEPFKPKYESLKEELKKEKEDADKIKEEVHNLKEDQKSLQSRDMLTELEDMNKLISGLLKERHVPQTNEEAEHLVNKYKKDILELQAKLKKAGKNPEDENRLETIHKKNNELQDQLKARDEEIKSLNTLNKQLKEKMLHKEQMQSDPNATGGDAILEGELDEMNKILASLLKERKLPSSDDENHALIAKYKNEIKALRTKISEGTGGLEKKIEAKENEADELKGKVSDLEQELSNIKEVCQKLKVELDAEKVKTEEATKSGVGSEAVKNELDEMSKLVGEFLKERRLPQNEKEIEVLISNHKAEIEKLKEEIKSSKVKTDRQELFDKLTTEVKSLKETNKTIDEELKTLKGLNIKLKNELEEEKTKREQAGKKAVEGASEEEFQAMNDFIATLVKERKAPPTNEESQKLIKMYKKEIENLKKNFTSTAAGHVERKFKEQIEKLEKELEETREKAENAAPSPETNELVIKLKKEIEEYEKKLNQANTKLSLYGEEVI